MIKHTCTNCSGVFTFDKQRKKCPNCGKQKLVEAANDNEVPVAKTAIRSRQPVVAREFEILSYPEEFQEPEYTDDRNKKIVKAKRPKFVPKVKTCEDCGKQFQASYENEIKCPRCILKVIHV